MDDASRARLVRDSYQLRADSERRIARSRELVTMSRAMREASRATLDEVANRPGDERTGNTVAKRRPEWPNHRPETAA